MLHSAHAAIAARKSVILALIMAAGACAGSDATPTGLEVSAPDAAIVTSYKLTITPSSATINVGGTVTLVGGLATLSGVKVATSSAFMPNWSSSNAAVATVSSTGVVKGVKAGSATITGNSDGRIASVVITVKSLTSTTTNTTTTTTSLVSTEPLPKTGDVMLVDTRRVMQAASILTSSWDGIKLSSAYSPGSTLLWEMSGPLAFTTNMDGLGTHAIRVDWKNWGGVCRDQAANIITYLPRPYQKHIVITWKTRLGRTATGGGVGNIDSFQITNKNCGGYNNTGGNAARKTLLIARDVPNMGAAGRIEYLWAGPAPMMPKVTSDALNLSFLPLSGASVDLQQQVGKTITQTLELQAASSSTAKDGIIRLWINGKKVVESTTAAIGPEAFHRFQIPSTFNSPMQDQSEYFWDIVAWTPLP